MPLWLILPATIGFALVGQAPTLGGLSSKTPNPSKRPNILTVDDARAVRLLARGALSGFECDVEESDNGFKALYVMDRILPDLILLDVKMPTMDGIEMLTLLATKPELKAIPVIMLISPGDHLVADQIAALGVSATLMKPFTPAALIEKVRAILPLKPRSSL